MDADALRQVVELATLAPSVHNTQPWRFVAHGDALEVWADRGRELPALDPSGRELLVSCGAAVYLAELGVRRLGRACAVTLLPDPAEPDRVARLEAGADLPASADELALAEAARRRHTDRDPYDPRPVPADLVDALRHGVAAHDAWLRVLERPEEQLAAAALLARADDEELADPAYREELRRWVAAGAHGDGVPAEALGEVPPGARASTFRVRDFTPGGTPVAPPELAPAERPLVAVLGTEGDDARARLQAGRALAWLLLRATLAGVSAQPMTQVVERPDRRAELARALDVVGHPQVLLRMGYGHGGHASPRRPVDEVLKRED